MYDSEGSQAHRHYLLGGYPSPPNASRQNLQLPSSAAFLATSQNALQIVDNHPHNEVIGKLVSMGYQADHVAAVIQRGSRRLNSLSILMPCLTGKEVSETKLRRLGGSPTIFFTVRLSV
ncbi:hypothetical protein Nepgr_012904 [Nepenthes gracilis]|uniref:DUF1421 domain-containing protein n=1 Tax=Nepenthes gracilis TaxID=150966 RepID=A0AAD3SGT7_NEPGR|nr:hypothetical protein Nepgr_012904 [Nepenthes gracilis]